MTTLIENGQIILKDRILKDHSIVIEKDTIKEIRSKMNPDKNFDIIIDAKQNYISPGFIDIHNHGNSGYDVMDSSHEALKAMSDFHIDNGVTSFLATTMTNPKSKITAALQTVASYMKGQEERTSEVLGSYLEGPYFNAEKKGAQPLEAIKKPDINELEGFIKASEDTIRVVALAPELKGAIETIEHLKGKGINIAIGHSNAEYAIAKKAIESGASLSTHLYNGMRAFSHREPGIIGACLSEDALYSELIVDGIHLHPAAVKLAYRSKSPDRLILISDAMRATGLPEGEYDLGGQKVYTKDGQARLEDGTLAGSTLTLQNAVRNSIRLCDIPLVEAVRMATYNPAKAIQVAHNVGEIKEGLQADILVFDANINLKHIIKKGKRIL
ncbi:MAG: N-acetylglucosamine-6-phosphate deacetylase [Candidatus Izemoplasmataceae bacterium]